MNPIQKLWLKVLSPVSYLINEKLAKRSGIFGKIGKFFLIGPREYGMHPINKLFIYWNRRYNYNLGFILHKYSFFKTLTQNGYHMIRPYKHSLLLVFGFTLFSITRFTHFDIETRAYTPDTLLHLHNRLGAQSMLPLNSLNLRTSGHMLEINQIYSAEMIKKQAKVVRKIIEERSRLSDKKKKTRYADPSYQYIEYAANTKDLGEE